ncbi:N-acetylglucosamine kinase [Streptomyces sp. NPDC058623]|uniref:N-acetylglucosamine kinase n=1 Tax=Streptomyces sp. NPDC058623 TaxID=3346563 RepID=UPI003657D65C
MSTLPSPPLVLGVDAGGTSTRCLIIGLDGRMRGHGRAGGANRYSGADPFAALNCAIGSALGDVDRRRVVAGHIALAGAAGADLPGLRSQAAILWRDLGMQGSLSVGDDLAAAVAAGTEAADALLLLAGTGAIAAAYRGHQLVARSDGYGWLLGDEGSGMWIGRQALTRILAALDGRGPHTALTTLVTEHLQVRPQPRGTPTDLGRTIVTVVHAEPPAAMARLAPLVDEAARRGDPVAGAIIEEAAGLLLNTLRAAQEAGAVEGARIPLVLAGGLLVTDTLVAEAVETRLRADGHGPVHRAKDGAAGAAALALRRLPAHHLPPAALPRLHRLIIGRADERAG